MQVRPHAALMEVDDAVAGPGVGAQGQVGTGGPFGLAGAGPSSDSGRKSGDESGGDSSRMDLGGASSGEEGSTGCRGGTPGSNGYGGYRKGAGRTRKGAKKGLFWRHQDTSPGTGDYPCCLQLFAASQHLHSQAAECSSWAAECYSSHPATLPSHRLSDPRVSRVPAAGRQRATLTCSPCSPVKNA